jgi:hypothetical protein
MRTAVLGVFLLAAMAATAAAAVAPTAGESPVKIAVTKDNSIVLVDKEWQDNGGRLKNIRIKGNQHIVAMMFDVKALEGRIVRSAVLVCPSPDLELGPKEGPIKGLTISTISAEWDEYKSNSMTSGPQKDAGWGYPGARFPAVMGGNGNTLVCQSRSTVESGAYRWEVAPDLVQAIAIGAAHGLALHEWDADYSRNPLIYSREEEAKAPYLLITFGPADADPAPQPPSNLKVWASDPADPAGVRLSLQSPAAGFAYEILVNGKPLPRWNVPFVRPQQVQVIPIRDVPHVAGDAVQVSVQTVSRTGKRSAAVSYGLPRQVVPAMPALPDMAVAQPPSAVFTPGGGRATTEPVKTPAAKTAKTPEPPPPPPGISVIPEEDKYDALGNPVGDLPADYRTSNGVFDGRTIRLVAARGEVVGFQALLVSVAQPPSAVATPEGGRATTEARVTVRCSLSGLRVDLYRALYVTGQGGRRIPDPLVPVGASDPLLLVPDEAVPLLVDVFVPPDFKGARVEGALTISDGRKVPIVVDIRNFTLPGEASFFCEMNGYGLPDRLSEYYRLQEIAYEHRVHVNLLAYSHQTAAPGARKSNMDMQLDFDPSKRPYAAGSPVTGQTGTGVKRMDEKRFNDVALGATQGYWDDFVKAFGPYLSGKYFAKGYRGPVPAPGFYLPFHESWPLNVRAYFNGNPDAYEAFKGSPKYASTWVCLMQDFITVARREGWEKTGFQVYLNNKGSLRDTARAPWILDEPTSYWDYRALAFYGDLFRQARWGGGEMGLGFRIDISRPEFDRGQLEGKADLWVVSTDAFHNYRRLVTDRTERTGERVWIYGSTNRVEESNRMIEAWALDAYVGGARGLVPWQTINGDGSAMTQADQLGLFIFSKMQGPGAAAAGRGAICHSMRLKAYRRAEQDVEYLELVRSKAGLAPAQVRAMVDHYVSLGGRVRTENAEDAGTPEYAKTTPESLRQLREAAAMLIEKSSGK